MHCPNWFTSISCKEDEREWRAKMAKSKTRTNFVALVPTSKLKSKGFEKLAAFDSRGSLKWKVMTRVKCWCRASWTIWRRVGLQPTRGEKAIDASWQWETENLLDSVNFRFIWVILSVSQVLLGFWVRCLRFNKLKCRSELASFIALYIAWSM